MDVMLEGSRGRSNVFARRLFAPLSERYDLLAEVLSAGQNRRWRNAMVEPVVAARPRRVLHVAAGTCSEAIAVMERCSADVVALDLTSEMLLRGRERIAGRGFRDRASFVVGRAENLPFPDGCFDALTFTYLLRYVEDPVATIRELARVVSQGGVVASLEFAVPCNPLLRSGWWAYTRSVLPLGGLLGGGRAWLRVGRFLGPSISSHYRRYPLDWTVEAWRAAGLTDITVRQMSLGAGLVMWGVKADG